MTNKYNIRVKVELIPEDKVWLKELLIKRYEGEWELSPVRREGSSNPFPVKGPTKTIYPGPCKSLVAFNRGKLNIPWLMCFSEYDDPEIKLLEIYYESIGKYNDEYYLELTKI